MNLLLTLGNRLTAVRSLIACLGLAATGVIPPGSFAAGADRSPPNIVVVITDDQGYAQLGRHGHPWLRTPHTDRLFDESTRFDRFLVSPTCAPTRAALMTGRHPMRNGITHTILERERMTLDAVTLPEVLKTAGYTTGIFGKWHLGDEEPYQPHRRGFDEAFIHGGGGIGQAYPGSCADAPGNKYFDPVIRHNGSFVKTHGYCTDLFFTAALGWIKEAHKNRTPFFAYVATNTPHEPFVAPPKNTEHFKNRGFSDNHAGFYGMIENLDENLGRMLDSLESWGVLENTVFIFMSDNGTVPNGAGKEGDRLGQQPDGTPLVAHNAGMRGYKGWVDEGGVRVPFFVRWPGHAAAGRSVEEVTAHIDLLPTLAEIAGANPPTSQVEGRSLLPLIEARSSEWPDRYLYSHVGRWPTGDDPNKHRGKGYSVRSHRFRLVNRGSLYDLKADPGQKRNVIAAHPGVAAKMQKAYEAWWEATVPMMVNESAPLAPTKPFHELYRRQAAGGGIPAWTPPEL